jgi:hypothetical protein
MKHSPSMLLATGLAVAASSALAQEKIPSTFVNSLGFTVTGFNVRQTGAGCAGSQTYEKAGDKGVSQMRWSNATKQDGGVLCTGGTWYYGGGPQKGQAGGATGNILIKNGSYYRVQ